MSERAKLLIGVVEVDQAGRIRQMNYVPLRVDGSDMGTSVIDGLPGKQADGIPDAQCPAAEEPCVAQPVTDESRKIFDATKFSLEASLKLFDGPAVVCKLIKDKSGELVECKSGITSIALSDDTGDGRPDHAAITISTLTAVIVVLDYPIALIKGANELYRKGIPAAK